LKDPYQRAKTRPDLACGTAGQLTL